MNQLIAWIGLLFQPKKKKIFSDGESAIFYWKGTDSYSLEFEGYTFFDESEEGIFKKLAEMELRTETQFAIEKEVRENPIELEVKPGQTKFGAIADYMDKRK